MSKKMNKLVNLMCVMLIVFVVLSVVMFVYSLVAYGNYYFTTIPGYREHLVDVNPVLFYSMLSSIICSMVVYMSLLKLAQKAKRHR